MLGCRYTLSLLSQVRILSFRVRFIVHGRHIIVTPCTINDVATMVHDAAMLRLQLDSVAAGRLKSTSQSTSDHLAVVTPCPASEAPRRSTQSRIYFYSRSSLPDVLSREDSTEHHHHSVAYGIISFSVLVSA